LIGWLRTTLAQRFVDHYRRTYREQTLDEQVHEIAAQELITDGSRGVLESLRGALEAALRDQPAEERFVLAAYYIDDKTLAEIARVLGVHEATISRRLRRTTEAVRKQVMRNLQRAGMSRRAAEEALGTDPHDVELGMDLKKLLQYPKGEPFQYQARGAQVPPNAAAAPETLASGVVSDKAGEASGKKTAG
jgi:RNA polymerase sigma-70 factor (ECF subfamily)